MAVANFTLHIFSLRWPPSLWGMRVEISLQFKCISLRVACVSGAVRKRSVQPASFLSSRSKSLPVDGLPWPFWRAVRLIDSCQSVVFLCARVFFYVDACRIVAHWLCFTSSCHAVFFVPVSLVLSCSRCSVVVLRRGLKCVTACLSRWAALVLFVRL